MVAVRCVHAFVIASTLLLVVACFVVTGDPGGGDQVEIPQWAMAVVFASGIVGLFTSVGLLGTVLWRLHSGRSYTILIDDASGGSIRDSDAPAAGRHSSGDGGRFDQPGWDRAVLQRTDLLGHDADTGTLNGTVGGDDDVELGTVL